MGVALKLSCVKRAPADRMRIVEFDDEGCARDRKLSVLIEVEIDESTCGHEKTRLPETIWVATPSDFRSLEGKRAQYVGKQHLYFLEPGNTRRGSSERPDALTFARGR